MLRLVRAIAAVAVCAFLAGPVAAADLPAMGDADKAAAAPLTDALFRSLQAGQAEKGFEQFFAGTLVQSKSAELQNLAGQFKLIGTIYGPVQRWELATSQCYVPTVCQQDFVLHTENSPIIVRILLYKRSKGWSPMNISMGDLAAINPFN
jgi:hypothetical protein